MKFAVFLVVLALCNSAKTENRCSRRYITEPDSHLPVLSVDCAYLSLERFPSDGSFEEDLFFLDLSHNAIRDLDTPFDNKGLSVLILSYNEISVLEDQFFIYTPNLTRLDLSHNEIAVFENADVFYGLEHLNYLDLSFNDFKQLPDALFAPLINLQTLKLNYNNLTQQLALSDLNITTALNTLEMNKIGLQDPSNSFFDHYNNLKHLSLADNDFQEVPIVPYSVEYLDLSGSRITTLAARNLNYHSLKTLILNRSWKLEKIDRYAFYNLQSLETLSLDDCPRLKEFNDEVFGVITKDVGLALKRFTLARTGVQSLNYTFTYLFDELEYVDLGENPWKCDCGLFWLRIFNKTVHRYENVRLVLIVSTEYSKFWYKG